jgi:hypothetical protein
VADSLLKSLEDILAHAERYQDFCACGLVRRDDVQQQVHYVDVSASSATSRIGGRRGRSYEAYDGREDGLPRPPLYSVFFNGDRFSPSRCSISAEDIVAKIDALGLVAVMLVATDRGTPARSNRITAAADLGRGDDRPNRRTHPPRPRLAAPCRPARWP